MGTLTIQPAAARQRLATLNSEPESDNTGRGTSRRLGLVLAEKPGLEHPAPTFCPRLPAFNLRFVTWTGVGGQFH